MEWDRKKEERDVEKERGEIREGDIQREEERGGGERQREEEEMSGVAGHGHSLSLTTAAFISGGNTQRVTNE